MGLHRRICGAPRWRTVFAYGAGLVRVRTRSGWLGEALVRRQALPCADLCAGQRSVPSVAWLHCVGVIAQICFYRFAADAGFPCDGAGARPHHGLHVWRQCAHGRLQRCLSHSQSVSAAVCRRGIQPGLCSCAGHHQDARWRSAHARADCQCGHGAVLGAAADLCAGCGWGARAGVAAGQRF